MHSSLGCIPLTHICAISNINRRKPRHAFRFGTEGRHHGIEERKGYRCTYSAEESPPCQSSLCNDHLTSIKLFCMTVPGHRLQTDLLAPTSVTHIRIAHLHRHSLGERNAHHDLLNQGCKAVIVSRRTSFDRAQRGCIVRLKAATQRIS